MISPPEAQENWTQTKTGFEATRRIWAEHGSPSWIQPVTKPLSQLTHYPRQEGDPEDEEKGGGPAGLQVVAAKMTVANSER